MPVQSPDYKPGQILPGTKYQIVRELGSGGMGVVYQVVKPPQIQGVLKLMSPDLAAHDEFRRRFLDEVHVLAQLDHPNIVKVSDYDALSDGVPFYVMELLTGRTVRDVLATVGRVPPRVAFEITRQLCEALHCAHTHTPSVVHRDIKPENIFLHAPKHGDPTVKLIDFGVVAIADRVHDGTFVGTWRYAAPEQIRGERATPATDLYSVGLVLYEMLAGAGPFDHIDTGQLISQAHLRDTPPPISKFAPWVPKSIEDLIRSALEKDPARRPRDAYAFAERLFELEWATDGKAPHEPTTEGPIAKVLSQVAAAGGGYVPPSVPQLAVEPVVRHKGPTIPGVGDEAPPPSEDELLAALVARPDVRIPSSRGGARGTPQPPNVVVRPGGSSQPKSPTAVTVDASNDTFASQSSDPGRVPPKKRAWIAVPIALVVVVVLGLVALLGLRRGEPKEPSAPPVAAAPPAATSVPARIADPAPTTPPTVPAAPAPSPTPEPIATVTPPAIVKPVVRSAPPPATAPAPSVAPAPPAKTAPAGKKDEGYLRSL